MSSESSDGTTLESGVEEFRAAAYKAVDWICDYLERGERLPVVPRVAPGEIASRFAAEASEEGRPLADLVDEFESKIVDGITHWNQPGFLAYFAITGSQAGVVGELLSAALNANGMLWKTSPAVTELEVRVLDWLREALGLPRGLFGIINDTASINSFLALAAAREQSGLGIRQEGMTGRTLPRLRVYCSDQAHSSIEKGALALGFGVAGVRKIGSDADFRMDVGALERAIAEDRAAGVVPCAIVATAGTTSTASVDPIAAIGEIAERENVWLHVDAAYAGSATIAPEFRFLWDGIERADSIIVNPHKWLFTPVDCGVLYTRKPDVLRETFSLVPDYLKTSETDVINYMDYGLQLGRRFRALKLWMVLEHYGLARLRDTIRQHVEHARRLAAILEGRDDVELVAPQMFSVVVFRRVVRTADGAVDEAKSEEATAGLVEKVNEGGELFISATRLRGVFAARVAIGNGRTAWRHVERLLDYL
jgi:aromatic-L-amino-acid/L-tryptophan decarboxylase